MSKIVAMVCETVSKCVLNYTHKLKPLASGITTNRMLTKTFASVSNENSSFMITLFLGNDQRNTDKRHFPVHPATPT